MSNSSNCVVRSMIDQKNDCNHFRINVKHSMKQKKKIKWKSSKNRKKNDDQMIAYTWMQSKLKKTLTQSKSQTKFKRHVSFDNDSIDRNFEFQFFFDFFLIISHARNRKKKKWKKINVSIIEYFKITFFYHWFIVHSNWFRFIFTSKSTSRRSFQNWHIKLHVNATTIDCENDCWRNSLKKIVVDEIFFDVKKFLLSSIKNAIARNVHHAFVHKKKRFITIFELSHFFDALSLLSMKF